MIAPDHYYIEDFEDGTITSSTGRTDRHPIVTFDARNGLEREDETGTLQAHGKHGGGYSLNATPLVSEPVAYHFRTRDHGSCFEATDVNVTRASVGGSGGAKLAMQTSQGVRRLTPVECERLQGFPDDWTALGPDSRRYAALGDAVTVPVAEWIGRRIMRYG